MLLYRKGEGGGERERGDGGRECKNGAS